jgi:hypothetical protein
MPPEGSDLIFDHRHNAAFSAVGRDDLVSDLPLPGTAGVRLLGG